MQQDQPSSSDENQGASEKPKAAPRSSSSPVGKRAPAGGASESDSSNENKTKPREEVPTPPSKAPPTLRPLPADSILDENHYPERVEEAGLMLIHATSNGLPITEETIAGVVEARRHLRHGSELDAPAEVRFWKSFNELSSLIQPVSVSGLKSAYEGVSRSGHKARSSVLYYQIGSVVFLIIMLIFQAYLVMGSMLMEDIDRFDKKISELVQSRRNLQELVAEEKRANNQELNRLELELDTYFNRRQASYDILDQWKPSNLLIGEGLNPDTWSSTTALATTEIEMRFVLQIIQLYILPLFYGLLGGFAYVLRNLTGEVRNLTYSAESKVNYRLRLQLGALAGLAIGWFINPGVSLGSLSPLALAFLAGYSVEVLFSGMDRLINRFANPQELPRKRAREEESPVNAREQRSFPS